MNLFSADFTSPSAFLKKQKIFITLLIILFIILGLGASSITGFSGLDALKSLPKVTGWIFSNLFPDGKAISRLPKMLDKLVETIFMAIMSSVSSAFLAFFFALMGATTTRINKTLGNIARAVASINRNIPVVAWAMIFLLTYGQSSFTGFLALFFASFGFLTRAFMETIDEASYEPVEALKASGANYLQIIAQAVIPSAMPQLISWILYMIEVNIRSATLVGLLTGSGIGFLFSIYYKSLQYKSASLLVILIMAVVISIELISNLLRRKIL